MVTIDPGALRRGEVVHLPALIDAATVSAVRASFWDHLEQRGIDRVDRSTWPVGSLSKLQPIASAGALHSLDTPELQRLGLQVLGTASPPSAWAWAPLVTFPTPGAPWRLPHQRWHLDEAGRGDPEEHRSLRLFVLLSDVTPTDGVTLVVEGSAALVRRLVRDADRRDAGSSTEVRRSLGQRHEWFRLLMSDHDARLDGRLLDGEEVDGVHCRVAALAGSAGDVWCMDQWTLHNGSVHAGTAPRFAATLFAHV